MVEETFEFQCSEMCENKGLPYSYKFSRVLIFAHFRAKPGFARHCAKISTEFHQFRARK